MLQIARPMTGNSDSDFFLGYHFSFTTSFFLIFERLKFESSRYIMNVDNCNITVHVFIASKVYTVQVSTVLLSYESVYMKFKCMKYFILIWWRHKKFLTVCEL